MSQLPNSNQNPFGKEDWLAQVIQLDPQAQKSQKLAFQKFNTKFHPKVSTISRLYQNYTDFVRFLTTNLIFSSVLSAVVLCTIGVSATQMIAPEEFKPSTLFFGKGQHSVSSESNKALKVASSVSTNIVITSSVSSSSSKVSSLVLVSSSSLSVNSSSIVSSISSLASSQSSSLSSSSKSPNLNIKLVPVDYTENKEVYSSSVIKPKNIVLEPFVR